MYGASGTSWSDFITNDEIRSRTDQPALSNTIRFRHLSCYGYLSRAECWLLTPARIITGLSGLALLDLLETGYGGLASPGNPGLEP